MGKKSKPQAPPAPVLPEPPDPIAILDKQAELNRVDQFGPFGNTVFGPDGSQTFSLSPEIQNVFAQALQLSNPLGVDNQFQDLAFDRAQSLIDRDFSIREDRLRNQLTNRGLPESGEAFTEALRTNIFDPRERAVESAAFNSIQAGDQRRLQDFQVLASLLGGAQTSPISPIDVTGPFRLSQEQQNANAQLLNQHNQFLTQLRNQNNQSGLSNLTSLFVPIAGAIGRRFP